MKTAVTKLNRQSQKVLQNVRAYCTNWNNYRVLLLYYNTAQVYNRVSNAIQYFLLAAVTAVSYSHDK